MNITINVKTYEETGTLFTGYNTYNTVLSFYRKTRQVEIIECDTAACKLYFCLASKRIRKFAHEIAKNNYFVVDWYKLLILTSVNKF